MKFHSKKNGYPFFRLIQCWSQKKLSTGLIIYYKNEFHFKCLYFLLLQKTLKNDEFILHDKFFYGTRFWVLIRCMLPLKIFLELQSDKLLNREQQSHFYSSPQLPEKKIKIWANLLHLCPNLCKFGQIFILKYFEQTRTKLVKILPICPNLHEFVKCSLSLLKVS